MCEWVAGRHQQRFASPLNPSPKTKSYTCIPTGRFACHGVGIKVYHFLAEVFFENDGTPQPHNRRNDISSYAMILVCLRWIFVGFCIFYFFLPWTLRENQSCSVLGEV